MGMLSVEDCFLGAWVIYLFIRHFFKKLSLDFNELPSSVERVFIEFVLLGPLDALTMRIFQCFLNGHNSGRP